MIRKIIAACMIIFFTAAIPATVFAESEFIPIDGDKTRDYLKAGDIIRAKGYGMPPSNLDKRDSFAKSFARQAARMDALSQLCTFHNGTVSFETADNKILFWMSQYSGMFKILKTHARQVGNTKFSDEDICEVTMEIVMPAGWKVPADWKN